jgi:hypothetical protein
VPGFCGGDGAALWSARGRVLLLDQRRSGGGVRRYDDDMARRPWMLWLLAFLVYELLWLLVWLTDRGLLLQFVS